jgi:hypothetical protein
MYKLSDRTKEIIENTTQMKFDDIVNLDADEQTKLVEKIIGKKLIFNKNIKNKIKTIEEINVNIDKLIVEGE